MTVSGQLHGQTALTPWEWVKRLGEPQSRSGMLEIELRFLGRPACSLVAISTELSWIYFSVITFYDAVTVSDHRLHSVKWYDDSFVSNELERIWPNAGTVLEFAWRNWGKSL
jgi:hypothetical protein